jgi:hypothetical protein
MTNQTLEINKRLYFLHIPRVGGMDICHMVNSNLDKQNIPRYPSPSVDSSLEKPINFNQYLFIQRHLGTYPIDKTDNLDVACLFRNPVDRMISNFNLAWNKFIVGNSEYERFKEIKDKLRYYLIKDNEHISQNNLQTRYVCNTIPKAVAETRFNQTPMINKYKEQLINIDQSTHSWHILNEKTSVEFAKKQIDSFSIIGISEKHNDFKFKIKQWFLNNYNLTLNENKIENKVNETSINYNNKNYSSKDLFNMLTNDEINIVTNNNQMDFEVYNYVKEKLNVK